MAGADKRAKLLSDLMAAKGGATSDAGAPVAPERAPVIQIAKRRPSDDRASDAPAAPSVLYSKGAATASTFRPSYWSFDHQEQGEPKAAPPKAAPVAPPVPVAPPAPVAPVVHAPTSRPLPINFVVAFGCVALFVSSTLFVLSQQHRGEPAPSAIAVASAPMPAAPVVTPPPAPPAAPAAMVPVPPPAPAPAVALPAPTLAPPPSSVAPAPTAATIEPPPAAIEPPRSAIAEPAVKAPPPAEPAPVAASTPASSPMSSANAPQADALLARGDDLLATGDVAAARLFYQRAAELGSAAAATAVGQTYDPGVLELLRVRGARGDVQAAAEWYRKAIAAGDRQAEIRLKRLLARQPG